ncbi:hypothetical protein [Arthrobacter sp. efr-133-TYG-118]|uniref:hypothetical protein n=1 Tax=Arthrobacter sp. efr-133-TYG-118 TaxID=3040279 RepID=UPI00255032B1|nr:hypothetical protein [Arthrobacter sp. efr-133-TYG-118]
MSEANKVLVRRHFQEIRNQRQLDVCDEIMADSYVEHAQAPFGTTEPGAVVGPQAMLQLGVVKQPGPPKIVAVFRRLAGRRSGK